MKRIEIKEKVVRDVNHPTDLIVFLNDCEVQYDLKAAQVIALGSLTVGGSMNVTYNVTVVGGISIGSLDYLGRLEVGGELKIKHGNLIAVSVRAQDIEVGGSIFVLFFIRSLKDIIGRHGIVAGTRIEARNGSIIVNRWHSICAGISTTGKKLNLNKIRAKEIKGNIVHGVADIVSS